MCWRGRARCWPPCSLSLRSRGGGVPLDLLLSAHARSGRWSAGQMTNLLRLLHVSTHDWIDVALMMLLLQWIGLEIMGSGSRRYHNPSSPWQALTKVVNGSTASARCCYDDTSAADTACWQWVNQCQSRLRRGTRTHNLQLSGPSLLCHQDGGWLVLDWNSNWGWADTADGYSAWQTSSWTQGWQYHHTTWWITKRTWNISFKSRHKLVYRCYPQRMFHL